MVSYRKLGCAVLIGLSHVITAFYVYFFLNESPLTLSVDGNFLLGTRDLQGSETQLRLRERELHHYPRTHPNASRRLNLYDYTLPRGTGVHSRGDINSTTPHLITDTTVDHSDNAIREITNKGRALPTRDQEPQREEGTSNGHLPPDKRKVRELYQYKGDKLFGSNVNSSQHTATVPGTKPPPTANPGLQHHIKEGAPSSLVHGLADREAVRNPFPESYELHLNVSRELPTIFVITPTYARLTQKVDLTSLCYTLTLVPQLVWIVVEDSSAKSNLVKKLLARCQVESVHLNAENTIQYVRYMGEPKWRRYRGIVQRNFGLRWSRDYCTKKSCNGVVYFADDDNKYDLRLFDEMRKTNRVSVFLVAFAGGLRYEGPLCEDGKTKKWLTSWDAKRVFPLDMAGFAINMRLIMQQRYVCFGHEVKGVPHEMKTSESTLETAFLEHFATREDVECRGTFTEPYVWHTKTMDPKLNMEENLKHTEWFDPAIEY